MDGSRGSLKPFIVDIPLGWTDGRLAGRDNGLQEHAGPNQRGRASSVDLGIESSFRHPDVVCFITFVSGGEAVLDRPPKPAFQANSKFFKAQTSQPYPQPNLAKKKALLLLDPLFRNEPFQELAPATRAFFLFSFRAIPSDERRGGHGQLSARRRLPQNVGGMSHPKA
jgi:hypothetical protein